VSDRHRHVLQGAALGALVGGLVGWLYDHQGRGSGALTGVEAKPPTQVDRQAVLRLGWAVARVIRQILELG